MDAIRAIADDHGLFVVEDAAQELMSSYRGRPAGSLGDLAALSFHETKNVMRQRPFSTKTYGDAVR